MRVEMHKIPYQFQPVEAWRFQGDFSTIKQAGENIFILDNDVIRVFPMNGVAKLELPQKLDQEDFSFVNIVYDELRNLHFLLGKYKAESSRRTTVLVSDDAIHFTPVLL